MIWVIFFLIGLILFAYCIKKGIYDTRTTISFIIMFVSLIFIIICIAVGMFTYPNLLGQYQKAKIFQKAYYIAEYNASLTRAQFYKKNSMWIIFGHGIFISNKIFQLPKIKMDKGSVFYE